MTASEALAAVVRGVLKDVVDDGAVRIEADEIDRLERRQGAPGVRAQSVSMSRTPCCSASFAAWLRTGSRRGCRRTPARCGSG
jgi:hypothetical protein